MKLHQQIRDIMRGNAKAGKHDRDAFHIVESAKYGGYFITNDDRILKKAPAIESLVQVEIVTPTKFLARYRRFEAGTI